MIFDLFKKKNKYKSMHDTGFIQFADTSGFIGFSGGRVRPYTNNGEAVEDLCGYCKSPIHLYTHSGGSRCRACPRCLEPVGLILENIKLENVRV
jgi:hypothetical protein